MLEPVLGHFTASAVVCMEKVDLAVSRTCVCVQATSELAHKETEGEEKGFSLSTRSPLGLLCRSLSC